MRNSPRPLRLYSPSLITLAILLPFFAYYVRLVKLQEGYLNDRAFRVLEMAAGQFDADIKSVREAMRAANLLPEQFNLRRKWKAESRRSRRIFEESQCPAVCLPAIQAEMEAYLRTYITHGESSVSVEECGDQESQEEVSLYKTGTEPYRIQISLKQTPAPALAVRTTMKVQLDPAQMLDRAIGKDDRELFETVILATRDGKVIASRGTTGVVDVESLLAGKKQRAAIEGTATTADKKPAGEGAGGAANVSAALSGANERVEIEVSGTAYALFVTPAPFTLQVDGKPVNPVFYGLAPRSVLDSSSLRLPSITVPLMISLLVLGLAFLWPALKLYTMSPKERLKKGSISVMLAVTAIASLLVAGVYLLAGFSIGINSHRDRQLRQLASSIRGHLDWEIKTAIDTSQHMVAGYLSHRDPTDWYWAERVGPPPPPEDSLLNPAYFPLSAKIWGLFKPVSGSAARIRDYPYFSSITITGDENTPDLPKAVWGQEHQIVKLLVDPLPTPLIALPQTLFPSVNRLLYGDPSTIVGEDGSSKQLTTKRFLLESRISRNTGEFLPLILMSSSEKKNPLAGFGSRYRILLATQLPSLVNVVFPRGFGFAVVDPIGNVKFHSDTSRNLRENFFDETADPRPVREAVALKRAHLDPIELRYGGRRVRALIQPLAAGNPPEAKGIHNMDLTLIVFSDSDEVQELIASIGRRYLKLSTGLPAILVVVLVLGLILWHAVVPATMRQRAQELRWPWPSAARKSRYVLEGGWGVVCCALAAALIVVCRLCGNWATAVLLPLLLALVLALSVTGFIGIWRRDRWAEAVISEHCKWIERLADRWPLATAYAARIFGSALGLVGLLAALVFQSVLTLEQFDFENRSQSALAVALEERDQRNLAAVQKLLQPLEHDQIVGACPLIESYYAARFMRLDLYDERAESAGILPALRSSWPAKPFLAEGMQTANRAASAGLVRWPELFPLCPPPPQKELAAAVESPGPPQGSESVWAALPIPPLDEWGWRLGLFFLLGPMLGSLIFLWVRALVWRLFVLDFQKPGDILDIDEDELTGLIMAAAEKEAEGKLDRILMFAHPRAGTGLMLGKITEELRKKRLVSSNFAPVNFAALIPGEPGYAAEFRKRVLADQERSRPRIVILDNFESRWHNDEERREKLTLLEALLHSNRPHLYVVTSVDPILFAESLLSLHGESAGLRDEQDRWISILSSFELRSFEDATSDETLSAAIRKLDEELASRNCGDAAEMKQVFIGELESTMFLRRHSVDINLKLLNYATAVDFETSLVTQTLRLTRGYYDVIWTYCTNDERLALYHLSKDKWLNPGNKTAISHLLRKRLVSRKNKSGEDGAFRPMNESFRLFVLEAVEDSEIAAWEREEENSLWPAMRMALIVAFTVVLAFVSYVRRDIFDVYFSYFVALAGGGAALFRVVLDFFNKNFSGGGAKPS